jgi:hypothetical protein
MKRCLVLDLRQLVKDLVEKRCHCQGLEADADEAVISAVNRRDQDLATRRKSLIDWLNRYRVLMGLPSDGRELIAGQVIAFADEREKEPLRQDRDKILSEFDQLEDRIRRVVPRTRANRDREITSLTSKALWCCYPEDIPIFDRNARCALTVISRICQLLPAPSQSTYSRFIDVWFQVYREVESVISPEDLSECPYKVRVLDLLLWHLGQSSFYGEGA